MNNNNKSYDYIIGGGGAAGLMLAYFICKSNILKENSVLIVEPEEKSGNDHTWCSWVKGDSEFDHLATKTWSTVDVFANEGHLGLELDNYIYRMIKSSDFYAYIKSIINKNDNITWVKSKVKDYKQEGNHIQVDTSEGTFNTSYLFKNYIDYKIDKTKHMYLDQHFKGWFIETVNDVFDESRCTMMDFRIEDGTDTRFMYVLPESPRQALIEIAIFSTESWSQERYDDEIKRYLGQYLNLNADDYTVKEKEFGIIPMTPYPFEQHDTVHVIHIGGAGGAIKASSGYAFDRIERQMKNLVQLLEKGNDLRIANRIFKPKYRLYDKTMLKILIEKPQLSGKIFYSLFAKNDVERVFKFLDEDTSFWEEIKLMNTTNIPLFLSSFIRNLT